MDSSKHLMTQKHKDLDLAGLIFISGPTGSGKSEVAEKLLFDHISVSYIATSIIETEDKAWLMRIKMHKERRPKHWETIEEPYSLRSALMRVKKGNSIIIDSLGGYVSSNLKEEDDIWNEKIIKLINFLGSDTRLIILVSEEVGWGIVPSTSSGNLFRDRLSKLSTLLTKIATRNLLVVRGKLIDLDELSLSN